MAEKMKRSAENRDALEYCIRCGFCKAICPSVDQLGWDSASARGRMTFIKAALDGDIELNERAAERIFQCTTCGDCKERCPAGVDTLGIIEDTRSDLVDLDLSPKKHRKLAKRIEEYHNPYGEESSDKNRFRKGADSPDVLYFMGCTAAYRSPDTVMATMDILDAAGVNYRILGEDEWCCGSVLRRSGYSELAEEVKEHNIGVFEESGVDTIITSCSGCFRTIKEEYTMEGIEVLDITQYVDRLLSEGKLDLEKSEDVITYHDPCHLGRHMGVYEGPRRVLEQVATLVEMEHCEEDSLCCGAGGGVKSAFADLSVNIGKKRMEEAKRTEADLVVTPCPFCRTNLSDSSDCLPVMDFAEYIASRLKE